jgi:outer membrane biosynthesis protein TonB
MAVLGLAGALAAAHTAALAQGDAHMGDAHMGDAHQGQVAHAAPAAGQPVASANAAPVAALGGAPVGNQVSLTDPVLGYYPAAARTAGVEGQAVIRCKRDEHLALTGCTLVSETPAGKGFGAAALAMAAKSPPNPKLLLKDAAAEPAADATIQFTLRSPFITPDLTRMAHIVKPAAIVTQPSSAQIQAAYPPRALDDQIQGGAVIECAVTLAGGLAECHVYQEQPTGYGFGQAAIDLAGDFTLKPRLIDGEPVGGSPVRISVAFTSNAPDAPLTLQSRPADQGDAGARPGRSDSDNGAWGGPNGDGGFGGPAQQPH